jgi:hypothetical protein
LVSLLQSPSRATRRVLAVSADSLAQGAAKVNGKRDLPLLHPTHRILDSRHGIVYGLKLFSDLFVDLIVADPGKASPDLEPDAPPAIGDSGSDARSE